MKAELVYRRTGNLRAVPLLLGYSKIGSTVRYFANEVDEAIEISEKIDADPFDARCPRPDVVGVA
jgi:hypothetical protein